MITNKEEILTAGLEMWAHDRQVPTVRALAKKIGVTHSAILYHWKKVSLLQAALAVAAVTRQDPIIVPILIVMGHPAVSLMASVDRERFLMTC